MGEWDEDYGDEYKDSVSSRKFLKHDCPLGVGFGFGFSYMCVCVSLSLYPMIYHQTDITVSIYII